jgi:PAS domain S-box-containing protein
MTKKTTNSESSLSNRKPVPPPDRTKLADAILSTALDCIIVSNAEGRIVEFNAAAERTFGFTRDQVLGKGMDETIVPHHHREAHRRGMERLLAGGVARVVGKRVEIEALHAEGHIFPVELSITETQMDQCRYFVATLRDLTEQKKAAARLQETQATLAAIFDNIPAALYLRDRNDTLVMMNNWGGEFLGRDPASMIGQPMSTFREPQNMSRVKEVDERIVRTAKPETHEFTYHLPGGDRIGLMTFFPVSDDKGLVTHIGGMLLDVTELHKARMELQQARASLQAFFDHAPIGIFINRIGPEGMFDQTVEFANDVVGKPYGLKGSQIVGLKPYAQFADDDVIPLIKSLDAKIVQTRLPVEHEMLNPHNNRYEHYTRFPILNAAGEITHIGGMNIDVDDRVRSKMQLAEAQALLESIFDNIPAVLYLRELDGTFITVNKFAAPIIGIDDPAKLVGSKASAFDTPDETEQADRVQAELLRTGSPVTMEYHRKLEGREITVLNTIFPVKDKDGNITKIGGFAIDVTELYNTRSQRDEAQFLIQSIFDNAPIELYLRELDGTYTMMNKWGANYVGMEDPADMVGKNFAMFDAAEEVELSWAAQKRMLETGEPVTREFHYSIAGNTKALQNTIFPVRDATGRIAQIGGVSIDVTALNLAKDQRDEARVLIQSIFDNAPVELYLRELDGRYIMMNKWGAEYFGVKPQDLLSGQFVWKYDSEEETRRARKAQATLLETGKPVTREFHQTIDGKRIVAQNTIFPVRDSQGRIVRIGGISIDVTDLNRARDQLQRAQENLNQSEKLAALGQLLAGVAHELNNPLAVVLGRAAILQEKLTDTPHAAPLKKLREAADRCARIVKTFLAMARQTGPRLQLAEVNELIESALEMTTYSLRKNNITFHTTLLASDVRIEVDQDQIVQVLINLILNSQQALENHQGNRVIDIKAEMSSDRNWLSIAVVDNGPGVKDAIAMRIFDPFFTTKSVGQGTGLGLSVCKSMVEAHGGTLKLEKTPGGGATFRILLPAQTTLLPGIAGQEAVHGKTETRGRILIVDDEVEIAAILADCLAPLNIECVIAADGHSALQRLAEVSFDAVFCDVSMPGMDGITFFHTLNATNPILASHLVFVSGDVLHRDWDRIKTTIDRPIIEKPFDPQQIRDAALQLLAPEGVQK